MKLLLAPDVADELAAFAKHQYRPTTAELSAYQREALHAGPEILRVAGDTAEIVITGVLAQRRSYLLDLFGPGVTVYSDVIDAIARADRESSIKRIVLRIDSPGGTVDGLFETIAAIESTKKRTEARASKALSGAFALASATRRIQALGPASMFGSVGIVANFILFEDEVAVTNTDSPSKRPDVRTEDGRAVVRRELDAVFNLFIAAIAGVAVVRWARP